MIKPRWILAIILIALLFFAVWLQYIHEPKKTVSKRQQITPIALPSGSTQISMIRIHGPQGSFELKCESLTEKQCGVSGQGKWLAGSKPANAGVVKAFLREWFEDAGAVIDLTVEAVEKRKKLLDQYELSEERCRKQADTIELTFLSESGTSTLTECFGSTDITGAGIFSGVLVDGKLNEDRVFLLFNRFKEKVFSQKVSDFQMKSSTN